MKCQNCGSGNTKKSTALVDQAPTYKSTGSRWWITSRGTIGFGGTRASGIRTSEALRLNHPPAPVLTIAALFLSIAFPVMAMVAGLSWSIIIVTAIVAGITLPYLAYNLERSALHEANAKYSRQWYCYKCGTLFYEPAATFETHSFTAPRLESASPLGKPEPALVTKGIAALIEFGDIDELYSVFDPHRSSVPVKALTKFRLSSTIAHPNNREPTRRQAAAIAIAFAAAHAKLRGLSSVPRVFSYRGQRYAIENGVLRDAVKSGLVTVSGATPETEIIQLTSNSDAQIIGLIGEDAAREAQII